MRPLNLSLFGFLILTIQQTLSFVDPDDLQTRADAMTGHSGSLPAAELAWFEALTSAWVHYAAIAAIVAGLILYVIDWPRHPASRKADTLPPQRAPIAPPFLSAPARAATDRVNAALGRLQSMPAETFSPESTIELAAIQDRHLPGLRSAHAKARAAFPADGPEAGALDTDLAGSLNRIADTLDELVAECGDEARLDFATERRFIELRHPITSDPLALPSVHIVGEPEQ
jgi:hypothetical protein